MTTTFSIAEGALSGVQSAGSERPVLLLHGNSQSRRIFAPLLEAPWASRRRIVALDLPGHGDSRHSDKPEQDYTLAGFEKAVERAIEELGLERPLLAGAGFGAHLALHVAAADARELAGVVALGAAPMRRGLDAPRALQAHRALVAYYAGEVESETRDAALALQLAPGRALPAFFVEDFVRTDRRARAAIGQLIGGPGLLDELETIGRLDGTFRLLVGEHDRLVEHAYVEGLLGQGLPEPAYQVVAGAGHNVHYDEPALIIEVLEALSA